MWIATLWLAKTDGRVMGDECLEIMFLTVENKDVRACYYMRTFIG